MRKGKEGGKQQRETKNQQEFCCSTFLSKIFAFFSTVSPPSGWKFSALPFELEYFCE